MKNVTFRVENIKYNRRRYNWRQAQSYCERLIHAGYTDWRLPTKTELMSIVEEVEVTTGIPSINTIWFPHCQPFYYWTSTSYEYAEGIAWTVGFRVGDAIGYSKANTYHVRCVR